MNYLIYNGRPLEDFGIYILGGGSWNSPERDVERVEVPGRSGDLTFDKKRFKNIDVVYHAVITEEFAERFDSFRGFILSESGYHRMEDTDHPDEYRMAEVTAPMEPRVKPFNDAGTFDITFNCKPQRYLKSGEQAVDKTSGFTIHNPTYFDAKPLMRVYGTGALGVGNETITITSANQYTDIDCEIKDAYKGSTNCNGNITLSSGDFPVLKPGNNGITLGNGITRVIIWPRWFTI